MRSLESFSEREGSPAREVRTLECRTALSPSSLPGLDLTLNPYRGCEHDCAYCYAPYLFRMSRGDWPKVAVKANIPALLGKEAIRKRGVIGLSTATDPYQPMEAELELTRRCLRELVNAKAKVSVLTKSDLVLRDVDLLKMLPGAEVGITITTIEDSWAACLEPGAPPPSRRLQALKALVGEGLDCYAFIGPIMPIVTDSRADELVAAIAETGCRRAMTDTLRLRPGMLERIGALPCASKLGGEFVRLCKDSDHLARLEGRIVDLCRGRGIEVESAF